MILRACSSCNNSGQPPASEGRYETTTGNCDPNRSGLDHLLKMKDQAIVCNIGHFDNEIQMDRLNTLKGVKKINVKP